MEIFLSSLFIADVFIEAIFLFSFMAVVRLLSSCVVNPMFFWEEALLITLSGASEVSNTSMTLVFLLLHGCPSPPSTETADQPRTLSLTHWHDAPKLISTEPGFIPFPL